jgi:hypothetical protein
LHVARDAKKESFAVSVPFVNTPSMHCAKEGRFCSTADAAIADDLIVGMLVARATMREFEGLGFRVFARRDVRAKII